MKLSRVDWERALVLLLVVALAVKTTWGVLGTFDILFDDETIYLEAAHWAGKRFLPLADSSPLYPLWYRALSLLEPDPVRLYFTNWFVLTTSLPVLLYTLARRSGAPLWSAAAVAVAWSVSETVITWPYVTKFAALVLGLGALAATMIRDRRLASAATVVALALASYARPELAAPAVVFAGAVATWSTWAFARTFRAPPSAERRAVRVWSPLAFALAIGTPVALRRFFGPAKQEGRAFFAFGQHYALNVVEDRRLDIDPWPVWDRFAREAFPHATTIGEAFRENPSAFGWHLRRNVRTLPAAFEQLLMPMRFVPRALAAVIGVFAAAVVLAGVAALLLFLVRRARLDRRLVAWLPLAGALVVTTTGSALLVYPREHYLLPLGCLGLAAVAGATGRFATTRPPRLAEWSLVAALATLAVLLPTRRPTALPALLKPTEPAPVVQEAVRTVAVLRALRLRGRVNILEPDQSRCVYAELDYTPVRPWEKNAPFWRFVQERQVGIVVLNWRLRADPRFKDDPEFVALDQRRETQEDFELVPVPGTTVVLAVRRSVPRAPSD